MEIQEAIMSFQFTERVNEHAKFVDEHLKKTGYERAITFLAGSQNYNLHTETSDVDTISVCIPKMEQEILQTTRLGTTYILPNGEHAVVKDIRDYINDGLKKQNINFVETLYTDYVNINAPKWFWLYEELIEIRDMMAHYSRYRTIRAACAQVLRNAEHAVSNSPYYPGYIESDPMDYDGKKACTALRIYYFLKNYMANKPYEICLRDDKRHEELMLYKKHCVEEEHVSIVMQTLIESTKAIQKEWNDPRLIDTDSIADAICDDMIVRAMKHLWEEGKK